MTTRSAQIKRARKELIRRKTAGEPSVLISLKTGKPVVAKKLKIPGEGAWSFEAKDVAEDFDHHVREQLPWYDFVTNGLCHIARHYISEGGTVYDVGSSTGAIGRALEPTIKARQALLYGVEKSSAMVEEMKRQYPNGFLGPYINVFESDASNVEWENKNSADLIVCFLVLMFVIPKKREELIRRLYANLAPGGAIVIVDRTAYSSGYAAQVLNRLTLAGKVGTGVPAKEIVEKELSLSGVQRPLSDAIFPGSPVEWFRFGDFCGWLIEKGEC